MFLSAEQLQASLRLREIKVDINFEEEKKKKGIKKRMLERCASGSDRRVFYTCGKEPAVGAVRQ